MVTVSHRKRSAPLGRPSTPLRAYIPTISVEAKLLWVAVLIFVLALCWWLTQDNRIPEWDSGFHMDEAIQDYVWIKGGHLSAPFTSYDQYPQLLQLVGAASIFIFGSHPMALVMVAVIIFTPMFAFGCYGVGRLVAGNRAGLLAGIVGLGIPIYASLSHTFDLECPEAALVAVSLWALLASRRFERVGIAALAGFLVGAAMLSKQTAIAFLAGVIFVMLVRNGWRNWRGLAAFAIATALVAGPWYLYHFHDLIQTFTGRSQVIANNPQAPSRWSPANLEWYFWCLVNRQALLPITLSSIVGGVIALRRTLSRLTPNNFLPELLVGAFVSYAGLTYLQKDPRYTVPLLVYVAVFATFWIVDIPRRNLRRGLTAALVSIAALNLEAMIFGLGGVHRVMIGLHGTQDTMSYPYHFTLYENEGWLRGPPQDEVDVRQLFRGLEQAGFTSVAFDPGASDLDFNNLGGGPTAGSVGLAVLSATGPSVLGEAYLLTHSPQPGEPAPCRTLRDGVGIYVLSGDFTGFDAGTLHDPSAPSKQYTVFCPGRASFLWPAVPGH